MSSSSTTISAIINDIKRNIIIVIQVCSISLFVAGLVGHTLSIYVLKRPAFRSNPCARYFVALVASGCVIIYISIPLRLLQGSYNTDVFIYSNSLCQFLSYFLNCARVLPSWFIVLASIDRYLCSSSSVTLRAWSNIRVAYRAILFIILFIALVYIHIPFYYTILLPQRSCTFVSDTYQSFLAFFNLVIWSWIPTGCMLVFGLLTIRHVRQGKRRIISQNTPNCPQRNQKKVDRQLIQMLLVQSFVFGSTTTLFPIGSLYVTITNSLMVKSDVDKARDNYLVAILNWLTLIGPCMSFYLFVLSSQMFRRELTILLLRRQPIQTTNIRTIAAIQPSRN